MPTQGKDRLHGTLDALVLKTLAGGPRHGYAISRWLRERSGEAILVEEGSLYPALYRMSAPGGSRPSGALSELGRKARFYSSRREGRKQLERGGGGFRRFVLAVVPILFTA